MTMYRSMLANVPEALANVRVDQRTTQQQTKRVTGVDMIISHESGQ